MSYTSPSTESTVSGHGATTSKWLRTGLTAPLPPASFPRRQGPSPRPAAEGTKETWCRKRGASSRSVFPLPKGGLQRKLGGESGAPVRALFSPYLKVGLSPRRQVGGRYRWTPNRRPGVGGHRQTRPRSLPTGSPQPPPPAPGPRARRYLTESRTTRARGMALSHRDPSRTSEPWFSSSGWTDT